MDLLNAFSGGVVPLMGRQAALGASWNILNGQIAAPVDIDWHIQFPAGTPAKLDLTSDSTNDVDATGSGAWRVLIVGCDKNYKIISEVLALNGQTIVTSALAYQRVFGIQVVKVNTTTVNGMNLGNIWAVKTGTGGSYTAGNPGTKTGLVCVVTAGMPTGYSGIWTVPACEIGLSGNAVNAWRLFNYTAGVRANAGTFGIFSMDPSDGNNGAMTMDLAMELSTGSPVNSEIDVDIASDWTRHGGTIYQWSKPGTDIQLRGLASAAATYMSVQALIRRM
jgi:hypothetical protein